MRETFLYYTYDICRNANNQKINCAIFLSNADKLMNVKVLNKVAFMKYEVPKMLVLFNMVVT